MSPNPRSRARRARKPLPPLKIQMVGRCCCAAQNTATPSDGVRQIPGSATVPVAVFCVSPDTFPSEVHGKVVNFLL